MTIIMIPFHDYKKWQQEGFRTRDAHLFLYLKQQVQVDKLLIINRPVSLAELCAKGRKRLCTYGEVKYRKGGICLTQIEDKVYCLDFFLKDFWKVLKERKRWWFSVFQYPIVQEGIKAAQQYLDIVSPVLLLQNPMAIEAVDAVKPSVFAFDAIDNWLYHPQMRGGRSQIQKNYERIKQEADRIFTVSQSLQSFFGDCQDVYWVPNGVDSRYFRRAADHRCSGTPVIGYVGKVQDRVDFGIIERCLQTFSACRFEILGPIYAQKKRVRELKRRYENFVCYGDVHYEKLPEAMQRFDIAILPHKMDEFTKSMDPLKLYEYLAAGKYVVSTKVAGTEPLAEYLELAEDADAFVEKLAIVIDRVRRGERQELAKLDALLDSCSWEQRGDDILKILKDKEERRRCL